MLIAEISRKPKERVTFFFFSSLLDCIADEVSILLSNIIEEWRIKLVICEYANTYLEEEQSA